MAPHGALIVVGSGPGVGAHVAAFFALRGFRRVVLMSRNAGRLRDDALLIRSVAPETNVDIITVDLVEVEKVEERLEEARRRLAGVPPECIFFNAARTGISKLLEWPVENLQRDLQVGFWLFPYNKECWDKRAHVNRYLLSASTRSSNGECPSCSGSPTKMVTNQRCL
jgi:NAD(P)-dependent dehydrogenase (short-subunit alcohol dehydrogenase family)